ncbi:MAG: hypothetical protein ACE5I3_01395 [Phycisphaerae bacterium]
MNGPARTIDAKTFAIGVLSITACILFVALLLVTMQPAYGIGQIDRAGDYIMLTQQLTNSQEGVIIIDAASRQMAMYALNGATKQLQLLQSNIPLSQLPGSRPDNRRRP